ncbi:MAG: hypothetical protein Q7U91_11835 [Sideroxyarcus sp.]|nr:hypothetical protein [Sideroxyarcus sp.]
MTGGLSCGIKAAGKRHKTCEPQKSKGTDMLRKLAKLFNFYENYRYYRHLGIQSQQAWQLAKVTLPD